MKQVLIADDEPHVSRVVARALERAGYGVETVPNGQVALARIRESRPDILITDIDMPRMNGEQLCRAIAEELPDRRFPIFVMTASTAVGHRHWARDMASTVFLEKPISVRKLMSCLEEHFAKEQG